ncbi:MAG: hypothetical protein ACEPO8_06780 [Rhodothermaceae bacterium]
MNDKGIGVQLTTMAILILLIFYPKNTLEMGTVLVKGKSEAEKL